MTSCILTIIKNEHQYLDEWIQYHLHLGIDHIFIFEDIDSDSHAEIISKYIDKVTLASPLLILGASDKEKARELKRTHEWNIQHLYFRRGLEYIRDNYQYDWCFVIDNDEFITIEENDDINSIISLYSSYDAFILWWKCYGACGYIKKPDYTNGGVVSTYIQEMQGKIRNEDKSLFKTCYNLKTYKKEYLYNQHYPTDECSWCNTELARDKSVLTYKHIYLRHYITRSWEEYVWKKVSRGYPWGGTRTMDFFFDVNPDMLPLKDELIGALNNENVSLIVLPYKQSKSQGKEIELALGGWRKYCQFKYHFIVIGEFDNDLAQKFPWVEFIYLPSVSEKDGQYTPHLDIMNKFNYVLQKYSKKYSGFIYITDDNYAIKPFTLEDITTIYCLSREFIGTKDQPTSYWNHDKWKTRQLLDREGLPHINYTTHYPYYMEFSKLGEIIQKFNLLEESYVFDDLYFNYFSHPEPLQVDKIRLGIWNRNIYEDRFKSAVDNSHVKFVCNSVDGWCSELEESLSNIIFGSSKSIERMDISNKVLITGSSGFIGTYLCKYLESRGYSVSCIDRTLGKDVITLCSHDIKDVSCIIHLAAQTSVQNTNVKLIEADNIRAFIHIFELCKSFNKRFIYTSSSCAYNITSMYGISKQFDEQYAKIYSWPGCVGLRLHNVYGPNPRKHTLPEICLNSDEITLYNSGQNYRHFTYIDDVCSSIEKAMTLPSGLYNVYNPEKNSTLDFANEVKRHKSLAISLISEKIERDKEEQEVEESIPNLIADHYHTLSQGISKIFL